MIVVHIISSLGKGGAEASLYQLVINSEEENHIVVSMQDVGSYGDKLLDSGVEVIALGMPRGKLTLRGIAALHKLIRTRRPDAVQTWMYHADLVGGIVTRLALLNRVVWGIHHSNLEKTVNSRALLWVANACAFSSWFVPKAIVSCSERSVEVHTEKHYRKSIFTVIPNGYDVSKFSPSTTKRDLFRSELGVTDEFIVGMVGRWHPLKDHENLVSAISILNAGRENKIRCVLVGKGMESGNQGLVSLLDKYSAHEYFILMGESDQVSNVMNGIDLHVLSSVGEAFPNVVAEAMACLTPGVVTDVGDAAVIVGDSGWVVPAKSPELIAQKIRIAHDEFQQSEQWKKRCDACRDRIVKEYEISRIAKMYKSVWESVGGKVSR